MLITTIKDLNNIWSSENVEDIIIKGDSTLHTYARNFLEIQSIKNTVFVYHKEKFIRVSFQYIESKNDILTIYNKIVQHDNFCILCKPSKDIIYSWILKSYPCYTTFKFKKLYITEMLPIERADNFVPNKNTMLYVASDNFFTLKMGSHKRMDQTYKEFKTKYFVNICYPLKCHTKADADKHMIFNNYNDLIYIILNIKPEIIFVNHIQTVTVNFLLHIKYNFPGLKLIIDTHDILSINCFQQKLLNDRPDTFSIISDESEFMNLQMEMCILNLYDEVWFIHRNEYKIAESYLSSSKIKLHTSNNKYCRSEIIFIGYKNIFNFNGCLYYAIFVYPHLKTKIKVSVVGSVCEYFEYNKHLFEQYNLDYNDIFDLKFTLSENELCSLWFKAKCSICPLLYGTGDKIKIAESIDHNVPVICTKECKPSYTSPLLHVTANAKEFAKCIDTIYNCV